MCMRCEGRGCFVLQGSWYVMCVVCGLPSNLLNCHVCLCSVRPALSMVEKKWIAFQLLRALKDSHEQKVRRAHRHVCR